MDGFSIPLFLSEVAQGSKNDGAKYFQIKVNVASFVFFPKMGAISLKSMVHLNPPNAVPVFSYQFLRNFFVKRNLSHLLPGIHAYENSIFGSNDIYTGVRSQFLGKYSSVL